MATEYTATTSTISADTYLAPTNPGAELDRDAFMKLLLTELQYQDPTDPMDSDKMLTQTSQLATLETQEATNEVMKELSAQMKNSMNMYAVSAVGKMASLGSNAITLDESGSAKFEVYFQETIKSGTLSIKDSNGDLVRSVPLDEGKQGVLAFEWDGSDDSGEQLPAGNYSITAEYLDANNEQQQTQFGIYPVESVRFDGGESYIKLGSSYVPMEYVVEYF